MASHFQSIESVVSCGVCAFCGNISCDDNCAALKKVCYKCYMSLTDCVCEKCSQCSLCVYCPNGCKCKFTESAFRKCSHIGCDVCDCCVECGLCKCMNFSYTHKCINQSHPRCGHCGKCTTCKECTCGTCTLCTDLTLCHVHACSDSTCSHRRCEQCLEYCCNDKSQCKCVVCTNVVCGCKHE
jgi:hypothetical protein